MYLKSIEIQGFKSFANKTVFEFHNGITCIVGPNGSGKSNVADAVRWVLGEQSAKQLRGANMQDIIFSGTELRRPQGFASVAITFDNADHMLNLEYDEVTVMRRVYRSGESEYRLNGSACRLKDINELFFDTGIGKEGYSIIGQGQIDRILSSKPEDRRELFDEAAGIAKFKYRKAVAKKKLESEETNMVRLNDIMSELEKQIGPLERQSAAAREYLKLRDELKRCEVNAFVLDSKETEASLAETERSLGIVSGDRSETEQAAKQLKEQYAKKQEGLESLERQMEQARISRTACQSSRQDKESRIGILQEQINTERLRKEHADTRLETLRCEIQKRESEKRELEEKRQELNRQIYDATSQSNRTGQEIVSAEAETERIQEELRRGREQVIRSLDRKAALTAEQQKYRTMLEQHRIRRAQFNQKLLQSRQEEVRHQADLEKEQEHLVRAQAEYEAAQELAKQKEREQKKLGEKLQILQERYSEQRRIHQAAVTKAESLRNLAERYEGYGGSIRKIMEAKSRYPGICGVTADLIHVEKRYETAIETALGGSIQNIVTDTEETAKELIAYLKQNRYGRATFLPLDAITVREEFRWREALGEPGVIGLASSLVQADRRYAQVIEFLLGRILVTDTIEHAMKVAARYRRSFRIVTLEGDLLNIGGSMTGGAFRNSSNLLGRNRELEELEQRIEQESGQLAALAEEGRLAAERVRDNEQELAKARAALQESALAQAEARMSVSAEQKRLQEILDTRKQTALELQLLEQSVREVSDREESIHGSILSLETEKEETEEQIRQYQQTAEAMDARREELAQKSKEQELTLARLAQSDSFLIENMERIAAEQEKSRGELEELTQETASAAGNASEKEDEIARLREAIEQDGRKITQLGLILEGMTKEKEKANDSLKGFFERQEELSARINVLEKEMLRLNHQKERLDEFLDTQTGYLWSEYELRPSEARAMYEEAYGSKSELKSRIQELKGSIRGLGSVNVGAIEEYRELMERWNFMKGQYDDLTESRQSLLRVIEELDTGMRVQFEEKFAQIRKEFDRVFKELFGGGRGTLELVEGEDIIEAGVTIVSQPPGKKLQNMMQLSGGERALTAIALLFAIQNLKPSPFCLLDEIEAALDDSNVGRFSRYLHKLTKHTQFIVITHRRGTMSAADRLYGITMQEKGVSALVSVSLIESELDR